MFRRLLLVVVLFGAATDSAQAVDCHMPSAPRCTAGAAFRDGDQANCKAALDRYRTQTQSYASCLVDGAKVEIDSIVAASKRHPNAEDYHGEVGAAADRAQRDIDGALARYNAAAHAFNAKVLAAGRDAAKKYLSDP